AMELALAALALVFAAVSVAIAMRGGRSSQASELDAVRANLDQTRRDLEQTRRDLDQTRREVQRLQVEVGDLKAATDVVPAPPLPKARPGGLDDLREQLRAAHSEGDEETER